MQCDGEGRALAYQIRGRIVRMRLSGGHRLDMLLDTLSSAIDEAHGAGRALILIDARESTTAHTTPELTRLAYVVGSWARRIDRVAVVARDGAQFGRSRMAASMAEVTGLKTLVCRRLDEAEAFLGIDGSREASGG